jgi:hypothetical protein
MPHPAQTTLNCLIVGGIVFSHGLGGLLTFARTHGNDEDAPIADLPHRLQNCGFAPERHHGIDRADRDLSPIGGA